MKGSLNRIGGMVLQLIQPGIVPAHERLAPGVKPARRLISPDGEPARRMISPGVASTRRQGTRTGVSIAINRAPWRQLAVVELPLLGLLALVFAISATVTPGFELRAAGIDLPWLYSCPLFALTGVPCLLCGMTRSFLAMGGLDLRQAFIFHPLGPVLFLSLVGLAIALLVSLAGGRRISLRIEPWLRRRLITGGSTILIIAWVAKVIVWRQTGLL